MTIYTRRGDDFKTDLIGGGRIYKDDLRIEAYGSVDELSAALGLARAEINEQETNRLVYRLQKKLQTAATIIADVEGKLQQNLGEEVITALEREIDAYNSLVPETRQFVIPGDCRSAAQLHYARTVARRVERNLIRLHRQEAISESLIIFLNRFSDLLFVLARWEQFRAKVKELVLIDLEKYLRGEKSQQSERSDRKEGAAMSLDLKKAKKILERAEKKAIELNVPMTIAIVDEGGNALALHRMDGALLASLDIAIGKAYTACSLRMSTAELGDLAGPGKPFYGIGNTNRGRIVIFGGGVPITEKGLVIGGLGVSGGSVKEDIAVADYALEDF